MTTDRTALEAARDAIESAMRGDWNATLSPPPSRRAQLQERPGSRSRPMPRAMFWLSGSGK